MAEQGMRVERGGVETYFHSEKNLVKGENRGIDIKIRNIVKEIEAGKQGYVMFDVDGCLIESGLQTAGNQKTIEKWTKENGDNIKSLQYNVRKLKENGIKVGLCTGRGLEFSEKLIGFLFPEESGIKLDESVVEGGLYIYNQEKNTYRVALSVDKESSEILDSHRQEIMDKIVQLGGVIEDGKMSQISFNPPINGEGKRNTDEFRELLKNSLPLEIAKKILITNSSSAVDITPINVDKMTALQEIVGDGVALYVGDGKNDESAMSGPNVEINLVPENAHQDIKDYVKGNVREEKKNDKIGLVANLGKDIKGVNKMLLLVNAAFKLYKKK